MSEANVELYYLEALRCYKRCYAEAKTALLQERFPHTNKSSSENLPLINYDNKSHTLPNLDANYLMKSALVLSAETDLERLLQKIMTVVLECSGAQHGYLLIKELDDIVVAAENHIDKQTPSKPHHYNMIEAQGRLSK
jgi:hypothetical protein